jgi:CheY-like chemotaxis protein
MTEKKILFIDDDELDLMVGKKIISLSRISHSVHTEDSVRGALAWLSKLKEEEKPDMIFTDLHLPGEDGWQFLQTLGGQPELVAKKTKIYMLSSRLNAADFLKIKMNPLVAGWFVKPFTLDIMFEVFERKA